MKYNRLSSGYGRCIPQEHFSILRGHHVLSYTYEFKYTTNESQIHPSNSKWSIKKTSAASGQRRKDTQHIKYKPYFKHWEAKVTAVCSVLIQKLFCQAAPHVQLPLCPDVFHMCMTTAGEKMESAWRGHVAVQHKYFPFQNTFSEMLMFPGLQVHYNVCDRWVNMRVIGNTFLKQRFSSAIFNRAPIALQYPGSTL